MSKDTDTREMDNAEPTLTNTIIASPEELTMNTPGNDLDNIEKSPKVCDKEVNSLTTPANNNSHSKVKCDNVNLNHPVENNVSTQEHLENRQDPSEPSSVEIKDSGHLLLNVPNGKLDEPTVNAEVVNQDNKDSSTNNSDIEKGLNMSPVTTKDVMCINQDNHSNENIDNAKLNYIVEGSVSMNMDEDKGKDPSETSSGGMDDSKPILTNVTSARTDDVNSNTPLNCNNTVGPTKFCDNEKDSPTNQVKDVNHNTHNNTNNDNSNLLIQNTVSTTENEENLADTSKNDSDEFNNSLPVAMNVTSFEIQKKDNIDTQSINCDKEDTSAVDDENRDSSTTPDMILSNDILVNNETKCNTNKDKESLIHPSEISKSAFKDSEPILSNTLSSGPQNVSLDSCENNSQRLSAETNSITNISACGPEEAIENKQKTKKKHRWRKHTNNVYIPYIYKLLGFQKILHFRDAKEILIEQAKSQSLALPQLIFSPEEEKKVSECRAIFTSNWPTWITGRSLKYILIFFTDINFTKTPCFVETLTYKDGLKRMGAALIRFTNPDDCLHVFKQLRTINLANKDVKVELDLDNKTRQTFIGRYMHEKTDGVFITITEDKWLDTTTRPKPDINIPMEHLIRVSVTSIEAPSDYRSDPMPSHQPSLSCTDKQQKAEITEILRLLGLPYALIDESRTTIRTKTADLLDALPEPPISECCSSILISNMPTWFEDLHFMYLLEVMTETNWNSMKYYLEILQYSNGVNRGAALLRLEDNDICYSIYKQLRRITCLTNEKYTHFSLDLDGKIAEKIVVGAPKVEWRKANFCPLFRSRYVITTDEMPATHKLDKPPLIHNEKAPQSQATDNPQKSNMESNTLSQSLSHPADSHSLDNKNVTKDSQHNQSKSDIVMGKDTPVVTDVTQINNEERLMDKESKEIVIVEENDSKNSNNNSLRESFYRNNSSTKLSSENQASASTTSGLKELNKSVPNVVHIKITPPGYKTLYGLVKQLLGQFTKFENEKYYAMRYLRDESNRILNECLIRFDSPDDALEVVKSLDGVTFRNHQIEAKLLADIALLSGWVYPFSNPLKRNLECGTDDREDLCKIAKFDGVWEIGNCKKCFTLPIERTEEKFGINPIYLRRAGVKKYVTAAIIVSNLHKDVTENKLHEVFSLAGNTKFLRITGGSCEMRARIEYYHPVEALQAVSMFDGQKLYGSIMKVVLCTDVNPKTLPLGLEGIGIGFGNNGRPLQNIPTYVETRKIYDIFHRMGQVDKTKNDKHPFLGDYTTTRLDSPSNMSHQNKVQTPKPNVATAIEAFGTVLVALDLIPAGTDHKDLTSIVNALQKHPKVKQHMEYRKKQANTLQQQILNQIPNQTNISNQQAEAFYQAFTGCMQHFGGNVPQLPSLSGNSQTSAIYTGQNTSNLNLHGKKTGPPNVPTMFPANHNMRPSPITNSNIPSVLQIPVMKPNLPNTAFGMPNINPNMQSAPVGTPNMNPHIQSARIGMPNMNPNMQSAAVAMRNMNPNMQSIPDSILNMNPNMQNAPRGMPSMNPNMQNHLNRGVSHTNMNPYARNPGNPNIRPGHPNLNQNVPEAPPPPRWGDPRFQDILGGNNMNHQTPAGNQHIPYNSNTSPPNRRLSNSNHCQTQSNWSHPSQPLYDPRSDSNEDIRDNDMDSSDSFESDLLQFKNLPLSVTTKALTRKMEEVGEVIFAEMTSSGRALVRFKRVSDAERCIQLFHRSKVDGHIIDVSPV